MDNISFVDVGIVLILFVSTLIGIYRGFLRELLTLFTWLLGFALAYVYGAAAGQIFGFSDPVTKEICGMIMILISVVLLGFMIKYLVCKWFNISGASILDRIVGALFGLMRGAAIMILVALTLNSTDTDSIWYKNSKLMPSFFSSAEYVSNHTPNEWKKRWENDWDRFVGIKEKSSTYESAKDASTETEENPAEIDDPKQPAEITNINAQQSAVERKKIEEDLFATMQS